MDRDVRVLASVLIVAAVVSASIAPAAAQPAEPDTAPPQGMRLTVGGEAIATYGSADPGFFDYASYDYSPLRNLRLVLDSSLKASRHLELLAQIRTDGMSNAQMSALYARIRPWVSKELDLQVGRIPPTFGLLGRDGYGAQEVLVGRPLPYGYLTSLRPDALPATPGDLMVMRGRGWLSNFPIGNLAPDRGLPLIDAEHWDTGVQVRVGAGPVEWWTALTAGSLANPRIDDDNDGRMVSTRMTVKLHPSLTAGASAARGAYLSRGLDGLVPEGRTSDDYAQRALGGDLTFETGRWRLRGEAMRVRWDVPIRATGRASTPLASTAYWTDLRVRVLPGLDAAARVERLTFGTIAGVGARWEAPVTRVEVGGSTMLHRHWRAKIAVQHNQRPLGGRVRRDTLLAGQLACWF
jgi:hypothetical protein